MGSSPKSKKESRFVDSPVSKLMEELYRTRMMPKAELARRSGMSTVYLHQIFSGKRNPSRDRVLCFCLGLGATVEEAQRLLEQGSLARLYARTRRDAILIHALAHKTPPQEVNDILFQAEEETLC